MPLILLPPSTSSVCASRALYDCVSCLLTPFRSHYSQTPAATVSTINVGMAASMGSFLLCAGTPGKRLALPHSRTMIHQPASGGMQGQASDIKVMAEQILYVRERCVNYYAQLSGQPREKVVRDLDRDNWLTAQEALEYGLIDKVISR